jgi:hypothetical protein
LQKITSEISKNILSKAIVDVEGVLLPCFSQVSLSRFVYSAVMVSLTDVVFLYIGT